MTAASSGDPGGSHEQWPGLGNTPNEFGALTYLLLSSKDEKKPLESDAFIVGKSIEQAAGGEIEDATTEARGTVYTLKVRNPVQVRKLLKMSTLLDSTEVVVQMHPYKNVSRCVISCFEIIRKAEKDILSELSSQGVIRVQRITRKEHGKPVNTSALILTFSRCNYPSHVKIGVLRIPTRPYYPNPLLCYSCVRYGHPRVRCPGPQRCLNCSGNHEIVKDVDCTAAAYCINCAGPHRPSNRQCPVYQKEVEIIRLKVDQNLTFPEARKRVETGVNSYAAAAAQQTADQKRIEELEKKMAEKDTQIAQLLEITKKKDDKIEKLMAHIQQMRRPQPVQQSKQFNPSTSQPTESPLPTQARNSRESQIAGSSMQLRTRSPATTEPRTEHGKKKNKKRNTDSNNTSPGRQSPPPKKPVGKEPEIDQEAIDVNEDEIEETPPSQHLR